MKRVSTSKTFLSLRPASWTSDDLRELRTLAERGCSAQIIAKKLRRTESSVRNKVLMHGLSLTMKTEQSRAAADERPLVREVSASDHHNVSSGANGTAE